MEDFFRSRETKFNERSASLQKNYKEIAWLRVVVFLVGILLSIYALHLREAWVASLLFACTFVAFGVLVNFHRRVKDQSFFNQTLARINHNEIDSLHLNIDHFDSGAEYLEEKHPYTYDLDIFGRHSLYQFISRAVTPSGKARLAHDLKMHFEGEEIKVRQQAIRELSGEVDWRQEFQAHGSSAQQIDSDLPKNISRWLKEPFIFFTSKAWIPFIYVVWGLFLTTLGLVVAGQITFYWIFLFNILGGIVLAPRMKRISTFSISMGKVSILLNAYSNMLAKIEDREWKNTYLSSQREKLFSKEVKASRSIKQLNSIIGFLDNRLNLFYQILNSFFLLDIYLIYKAEGWKADNRDHLEDWIEVAAVFESLVSFAAYSHSNEAFCFPELSSGRHEISARDISHPLIHPNKRVRNDFMLSGKGAVALITGSNMAGKSTFLRTIGINLVLAQVGAPVCASAFIFSPCDVFSSMRTKDNLEENVSTFYAELIRINQIIQRIDRERPLFYLLDEILKGTNSHDRHLGASALIRQLNSANTLGLVSSHDMELTGLSQEIPNLRNYSFHSEIEEDNIKFDYKLREGPCKSFNAVALMKKMGISVD